MTDQNQVSIEVGAWEKIDIEPWRDDVELYQPLAADQILLPENGSCLAVKAYLKMCHLPFAVQERSNAEFMSPGGRTTKLPFIRAGDVLQAEFEDIVNYVEGKPNNIGVGYLMDEGDKAEMKMTASVTETVLTMAGIYISVVDKRVYDEVTSVRMGSVYPWPLNKIQNYLKRRNYMRLLKVYQWDDLDMDTVVQNFEHCCRTLSLKLEKSHGPFLYGDRPCQLDAIAFGFIYTILTTKLPNMVLAETVKKYGLLVEFCRFIDEEYFNMNQPLL